MDSETFITLVETGTQWGLSIGFIAFIMGYAISALLSLIRSV